MRAYTKPENISIALGQSEKNNISWSLCQNIPISRRLSLSSRARRCAACVSGGAERTSSRTRDINKTPSKQIWNRVMYDHIWFSIRLCYFSCVKNRDVVRRARRKRLVLKLKSPPSSSTLLSLLLCFFHLLYLLHVKKYKKWLHYGFIILLNKAT